jgi:hypothetical protein
VGHAAPAALRKRSGLPALSAKIHVFYQNNNAAAEFMLAMREAAGLVP